MKKIYLLLSFAFIFILKTNAFANDNIFITVESYDKTISSGYSSGNTFVQCLDNFSISENLTVVYDNQDGFNKIFSVNGIQENKFGANDGWLTYIIRENAVIQNIDMLDRKIEKGDKLIVYYGDTTNTKIINSITEEVKNNSLNLKLNINNANKEILEGIRIHLYTPKNTQRIIKTDVTGSVNSRLVDLGIYSYYAESYNYSSYPLIAKTIKKEVFFGPKNKNATTRGEAIDFIVNNFSVKLGSLSNVNFNDTNINNFYFQELNIAATNKLVSGYEDNTFRGEQNISLLEFTVIISRLLDTTNYSILDLDVPSWAIDGVSKAVSLGYVYADEDFSRNVTEDDLLKIIKG